MNATFNGLPLVVTLAVAGCCTVEHPCIRDVPPEDIAQIARAMRSSGHPPIKSYVHRRSDPPRTYRVRTVDGHESEVRFDHGKWKIYELVVVVG